MHNFVLGFLLPFVSGVLTKNLCGSISQAARPCDSTEKGLSTQLSELIVYLAGNRLREQDTGIPRMFGLCRSFISLVVYSCIAQCLNSQYFMLLQSEGTVPTRVGLNLNSLTFEFLMNLNFVFSK